jgi:hypothetical protein
MSDEQKDTSLSRRGFFKIAGLTAAGFALPSWLDLFKLTTVYAVGPRSCGPPPPAAPQRIKGGESFPPLPLPATPLRRSERKREPAPPTLVGKVIHGKMEWATDDKGNRYQYRDWTTDPADVQNLLNWTNDKLGIRYRPVEIELKDFSYSPAEIPVLYFTGHEGFTLTGGERDGLRQFLRDGGFIIADACCGMKDFADAFQREIDAILPNRKRFVIPDDHPLMESFYKMGTVDYQVEGRKESGRVQMEGMNIGCRTAVFFSRRDLSCGWDQHVHPHGARVMPGFALQLGANLITYTLATYQLGRFLSTEKVYFQADQASRDEFVFGQIMHDGDWDPDPSAVMNLLKHVARYSTMDVQFKRVDVDLRQTKETLKHSFLYMTGHLDYKFSDAEIANLRRYLMSGGVLLADACCGRASFDAAFRREIVRVLPGATLDTLAKDHPLYSALEKVQTVEYTELLKQARPDFNAPTLEGLSINGVLAVVYSKYDLACGWEEIDHPYARGYASADSYKIGMNAIVYAMTH